MCLLLTLSSNSVVRVSSSLISLSISLNNSLIFSVSSEIWKNQHNVVNIVTLIIILYHDEILHNYSHHKYQKNLCLQKICCWTLVAKFAASQEWMELVASHNESQISSVQIKRQNSLIISTKIWAYNQCMWLSNICWAWS